MQITRTKPGFKRIFFLSLWVLAVLFFSGCYDLGMFADTEEYYNSFGNVGLIDQTAGGNVKDYSFADYFYNEKSVNDFAGDIVAQSEYIYMILPVKNNFDLAEFSVYLKPETSGTVYFSLYISAFIPVNIRRYDDPKSKIKTDDDNNPVLDDSGNPIMEDIAYGDLPIDDCIYRGSVNLLAGEWDSFTAKLTANTEVNRRRVTSGEYIVVKFENNGGFGKDSGYEKTSFSLTNLLIRAV